MSDLTVSKVFTLDKALPESTILEKLESALKTEFNKVKFKKNKNGVEEIHSRVKTKFFNPIVSLKAPVKIQTKENKVKIMIDGETKINGWFWFTGLMGIMFPPLWLFMIYMFSSQKKLSRQSLQNSLQKVDFEISDF